MQRRALGYRRRSSPRPHGGCGGSFGCGREVALWSTDRADGRPPVMERSGVRPPFPQIQTLHPTESQMQRVR